MTGLKRLWAAGRKWAGHLVKSVVTPAMACVIILALVTLLYLGPHALGFTKCATGQVRSAFTDYQVAERCWRNGLDRLQADGTAATVLLGIAAAVLAKAWSSGSSGAGSDGVE